MPKRRSKHQNGKAENRMLLHAAHRWPQAINALLWPAAIKHYTNLRNSMPTKFTKGGKRGRTKLPERYDDSPISRFSSTVVECNLGHFHPFGSSVYVLDGNLQAQRSLNKWTDRSKVGIFLCLVLNTQTGNVSPRSRRQVLLLMAIQGQDPANTTGTNSSRPIYEYSTHR
jgi:hypothetical protein